MAGNHRFDDGRLGHNRRDRLSDRTRLASALLALGDIPYRDAKQMTPAQIISLYHFDHNIYHESGHPDRNVFWNLTPRLIKQHRDKTRLDVKVIAKGRRIRRKLAEHQRTPADKSGQQGTIADNPVQLMADAISAGLRQGARDAYGRLSHPLDLYSERYKDIDWNQKPKRKIRSRGFDKTRTRGFDGKVRRRK